MKRTSLYILAAAAASMAAPAPAPAPAPVVATPAPAPVVEPAPVAAYTAPVATVGTGSAAPYAPVTDALLQNNPAAQGSLSSVLSIPHRWADKRVAVFQWSGARNVLAYGTMDRYFAGFSTDSTRGTLTGGYTTPDWAVGLAVNFGKQWANATDTLNGTYVVNNEQSKTLVADGFAILGSYKLDDIHLWGKASWQTIANDSSWTDTSMVNGAVKRITFSNRFDRIGVTLGARTYVVGEEGFAWRTSVGIFDNYLRPSGTALAPADSEYENSDVYDFVVKGEAGYRFAAPGKSQLTVGLNTQFNMTNGQPSDVIEPTVNRLDSVDYVYAISLRPNASLLLPLNERWVLLGGAGLEVAYGAIDYFVGDDEGKLSYLTSAAPTGNVGLRYAKDIWAVEAQVGSNFLTNGPYFLSGTPSGDPANQAGAGVLAQFALTVNLK